MTFCKEQDCSNVLLARGWCRKHYLRWRKYGDPSFKKYLSSEEHMALKTKICKKCGDELPVENFYLRGDNSPGYASKCKDCWKPTREQTRARNLRRYGITLNQYNELLNKQESTCAICDATESSEGRDLCVDHDHKTGQVRGLLCYNCNAGIGMFKDDSKLLEAAIRYLLHHRQTETQAACGPPISACGVARNRIWT